MVQNSKLGAGTFNKKFKITCPGRILLQVISRHRWWDVFGLTKRFFEYWIIPYLENPDLITIEASPNFLISCNHQEYVSKGSGISYAVSFFFEEHPALKRQVHIHLTKTKALYSGLEYRVSHAVHTYILLHQFFQIPCSDQALKNYACTIGKTGQFFVYKKPLIVNTNNFKTKPIKEKFIPRNYDVFLSDVQTNQKDVIKCFLRKADYYNSNIKIHGNRYRNVLEVPSFDTYEPLYDQQQQLLFKYKDVLLTGAGEAFLCFLPTKSNSA